MFFRFVGVFEFLLTHGVLASVAFGLRRERDLRAVAPLLRLSAGTRGLMYASPSCSWRARRRIFGDCG